MSRTSGSSTAAKRSSKSYIWLVGLLLVAVAATVIISATRGDDTSTDAASPGGEAVAETNDVVIDGESIPELGDVEASAGVVAPQVTGSGFTGEPITLLEEGTPAVIGFFAHWCPHCQSEVDELSKHFASNGLPDDVNVVAVSTGVETSGSNYPPSAWFASEGWPTPVLTDDADSSVAQAYGLSAFPFWAVVDADGRLITRVAGGIGAAQLDAFVELARTGA